jgi:hypothetical protein
MDGYRHPKSIRGRRRLYQRTLEAEDCGRRIHENTVRPAHCRHHVPMGRELLAAVLAEKGLTADAQALDGTFGFMEMFKGEPYDPKILIFNIASQRPYWTESWGLIIF